MIAQERGMSRVFTPEGEDVPVTFLQMKDCQVVAVRTSEKDGYDAVQLGPFKAKPNRVTKPQRGHFAKAKVEPQRRVVEFRVSNDALPEAGQELSAAPLVTGQVGDVTGQIGRVECREGSAAFCVYSVVTRQLK